MLLNKETKPNQIDCEYDTKLQVVRLQFFVFEECGVMSLLALVPGPLLSGVLLLVRVSSISQIDLYEDYCY